MNHAEVVLNIVLLAWLREVVRAPLQSTLSVIGIALGVAAVIAVDVANYSARESFLAASSVLEESATHSITGEVTDELYRTIRLNTAYPVQPVVQGRVRLKDPVDVSAIIYGIDPIAYRQFDRTTDATTLSSSEETNQLLAKAFSAFATADTLKRLSTSVGDSIAVRFGRSDYDLHIIGLLETETPLQQQSLRMLFFTDIATAQTILGTRGQLSSIQLQLPPDDEAYRLIESLLPLGALLEGGLSRQQSIQSITEAFQTNLSAMSLLTLLVAIFLIYNTMIFLVIRRKPMIKILRAQGVSRAGIITCVVLETVLIGTAASVIGFLSGIQLAKFLLSLVERSINNLYFPIDAGFTIISTSAVVLALLLGIGSSFLSSLPALREALSVSPSFGPAHHRSSSRKYNRGVIALLACAVFALTGVAILQIHSTSIVLGFAGIYCIVAAYFCLVPMLSRAIGRVLRTFAKRRFGVRGILASRALTMTGGRTSVAICALCIAISATIGVGVMISSFRTAVDGWLGDRISADIYISTQGYGDEFNKQEIDKLRTLPEVRSVGVANWTWLQGPDGRARIFAVDYGEHAFSGYRFKTQVNDVWKQFRTGGVIVSEPYAWKHGVGTGDQLEFWNNNASIQMPVVGVFYDYSSDRGIVVMHRDIYVANFDDQTITTVALYTDPESDLDSLENTATTILVSPNFNFWQARGLHEASMEVFDQTFAITAVLRSLAVVVAIIAVVSTLAMIQIDREREFKIQTAVGFTVREIWLSASAEAGVMGFIAGLLSIPVGLLLTWMLIWIVNQRSFGWTMDMLIDGSILVEAVVLAVVAALLAGILPAWRLAKRAPIPTLQME